MSGSLRISDSGDGNNAPPQLSLFGSKGEGPPHVEPRITLEQCLESRALSANHLLTDLQDRALGNRLSRCFKARVRRSHVRQNVGLSRVCPRSGERGYGFETPSEPDVLERPTILSEQGVNVLFVAFGFLKWFEAEHSEEPRLSPLLLVPVCLERMGGTVPWKLSLYEDEPFLSACVPTKSFQSRSAGFRRSWKWLGCFFREWILATCARWVCRLVPVTRSWSW